MKINDATDIRIGTTQASKVYLGTIQVWPTTPVGTNFLKTTARGNNTVFTFSIPSGVDTSHLQYISYSVDNGSNWVTTNNVDNQAVTITTPSISNQDSVLWKGVGTGTTDENSTSSVYCTFSSSNDYDVSGNILSLIWGNTNFDNMANVGFSQGYTFYRLFYDDIHVVNANQMVLPSLSLRGGSYREMFLGCTSLTTPPALPATTLGANCYNALFSGCTGLTTAPTLSATTMADSCYNRMFYGCSSLTTPPVLSSTSLAYGCYFGMFGNCTNLTTTPALPATTLANACYAGMFSGCSKITQSPVLPATTLVERCYDAMFNYCSRLNKVTCLATTGFNSTNCLRYWLAGVVQTGYFYRAYNVSWPSGDSGVPAGWTEMIYTP